MQKIRHRPPNRRPIEYIAASRFLPKQNYLLLIQMTSDQVSEFVRGCVPSFCKRPVAIDEHAIGRRVDDGQKNIPLAPS